MIHRLEVGECSGPGPLLDFLFLRGRDRLLRMMGPENHTNLRAKWYKCVSIKSTLFPTVSEIEIEPFGNIWAMKKPGWLGYIGDYITQLHCRD